eukprot:53602-Eustigmatos_ZCMA.PRE.1
MRHYEFRGSHARPGRFEDAAEDHVIRHACDGRLQRLPGRHDHVVREDDETQDMMVDTENQAAFNAQVARTDTARIRAMLRMDADTMVPSREGVSHEEWTSQRDHKAAEALRLKICQQLPTHVCAVCAMYKTVQCTRR